jgi:hypothetical protein
MDKQILFKEVQRQNQKWIWFLLIILMGSALFGSIQQIVFNKPFGTHPMPDWGFLPIFGILILFFLLVFRSTLYTEITKEHILFHYKPFFRRARLIPWEEVHDSYVRLYSPIKEYGGWGIRYPINGKSGWAYNVSGRIGIQLELKNGKKILIGTRHGKEAEHALKLIDKNK